MREEGQARGRPRCDDGHRHGARRRQGLHGPEGLSPQLCGGDRSGQESGLPPGDGHEARQPDAEGQEARRHEGQAPGRHEARGHEDSEPHVRLREEVVAWAAAAARLATELLSPQHAGALIRAGLDSEYFEAFGRIFSLVPAKNNFEAGVYSFSGPTDRYVASDRGMHISVSSEPWMIRIESPVEVLPLEARDKTHLVILLRPSILQQKWNLPNTAAVFDFLRQEPERFAEALKIVLDARWKEEYAQQTETLHRIKNPEQRFEPKSGMFWAYQRDLSYSVIIRRYGDLIVRDREGHIVFDDDLDPNPTGDYEFSIGRTSASHIRINDGNVSAKHAKLMVHRFPEGIQVKVRDWNARNGVFALPSSEAEAEGEGSVTLLTGVAEDANRVTTAGRTLLFAPDLSTSPARLAARFETNRALPKGVIVSAVAVSQGVLVSVYRQSRGSAVTRHNGYYTRTLEIREPNQHTLEAIARGVRDALDKRWASRQLTNENVKRVVDSFEFTPQAAAGLQNVGRPFLGEREERFGARLAKVSQEYEIAGFGVKHTVDFEIVRVLRSSTVRNRRNYFHIVANLDGQRLTGRVIDAELGLETGYVSERLSQALIGKGVHVSGFEVIKLRVEQALDDLKHLRFEEVPEVKVPNPPGRIYQLDDPEGMILLSRILSQLPEKEGLLTYLSVRKDPFHRDLVSHLRIAGDRIEIQLSDTDRESWVPFKTIDGTVFIVFEDGLMGYLLPDVDNRRIRFGEKNVLLRKIPRVSADRLLPLAPARLAPVMSTVVISRQIGGELLPGLSVVPTVVPVATEFGPTFIAGARLTFTRSAATGVTIVASRFEANLDTDQLTVNTEPISNENFSLSEFLARTRESQAETARKSALEAKPVTFTSADKPFDVDSVIDALHGKPLAKLPVFQAGSGRNFLNRFMGALSEFVAQVTNKSTIALTVSAPAFAQSVGTDETMKLLKQLNVIAKAKGTQLVLILTDGETLTSAQIEKFENLSGGWVRIMVHQGSVGETKVDGALSTLEAGGFELASVRNLVLGVKLDTITSNPGIIGMNSSRIPENLKPEVLALENFNELDRFSMADVIISQLAIVFPDSLFKSAALSHLRRVQTPFGLVYLIGKLEAELRILLYSDQVQSAA